MRQEFGLVIDWETTGLRPHDTPWRAYLEGPQGIEIGVVLTTLPDVTPIGEFVSRVRFLGSAHGISYGGPRYENLTWSDEAQGVHGIAANDLIREPTPAEVSEKLIRFILDTTGIKDAQKHPLMICGHNPAGDAYSLRQLLFLGLCEQKLRFHHRMIDSFTLGYALLGAKNSNDLFEAVSGVVRGTHNALQDARLTQVALHHMFGMCKKLEASRLQ